MKPFQNEPYSALTHGIGALLSIAGLVLMIVYATIHGTVWHVVGFTLFGTSLILLYSASTLYHLFPITSRAKVVMKRIDHAMIYVLIAGTYTPLCFVTLRGAWGWSLFGVIWGLAIIGVLIKAFGIRIKDWFSTLIYVLMGWLIVIAFIPLLKSLPIHGIYWLVAGGLAYTFGAVIYSFDHVPFPHKHFGMHEVWHLFVMAGSFCHFVVMFWYVL